MKKQEKDKIRRRLEKIIADPTSSDLVKDYSASLYGEDGKAHITVDLRRDSDVYEPYSSRKDLSKNIYSYVEGVAKYVKVSSEISVDFILEREDKPLEERIKREFIANYRFDFDEEQEQNKHIKTISGFLMFVGILFLVGYSLLIYFNGSKTSLVMSVLSEVVSIVSWVFIWAAVEKYFFDRNEVRRESLRSAQLADAEINFIIQPLEAPIIK